MSAKQAPSRAQSRSTGATKNSGPVTISFDVGGTGIKAEALGPKGKPLAERVRVSTPYPLSPTRLLDVFRELAAQSPSFDRISVGFPGVVRQGLVISAPHFVRTEGDETPLSDELVSAWDHFDLARETEKKLGRPTRVGNDAEVQGMAVVKGRGLEVAITLGTGFGTAVFSDGELAVHLELSQHPCHKGKTYNEYIGDLARRRVGDARWNRRVRRVVDQVRALLFFDHLYVGGGNSARLEGDLDDDVSLVDNSAGVLGGIKLWESSPRS